MPDESLGWTQLLGMGTVIAAQLAAGVGLGFLVDALAGTAPIFTLVGVLLGIAGAVGYTVMEFRKYLRT